MRRIGAMTAAMAALLMGGAPTMACGPESDCRITVDGAERTYRIRLPAGHDGAADVGAVVHAHGYRGTAAGAMRNGSLRRATDDLGVALIATQSAGDDWALPGSPSQLRQGRAPDPDGEARYFAAVVADAAERFPIDADRLMASGFSAGGMMTWTLACRRPDLFAGFAPISGTFWRPVPERCPGAPAHVIHIHGTGDDVVPLSGREIGPAEQGDVMTVLAMYREAGGFAKTNAYEVLDLACERWRNPAGKLLELCLHDGGHRFAGKYVKRAWRVLEAAGAFAE